MNKLWLLIAICILPVAAHGQIADSQNDILWGKVSAITRIETSDSPVQQHSIIQTLNVQITRGERAGETLSVYNDFTPVAVGDKVLIRVENGSDGIERASMYERNRTVPLLVLLAAFVIFVLALGGKQGVMSLVSLTASMLAVVYIYSPLLLRGYSPVVVSIAVGLLVAAFAIFVTHGFRRATVIAYGATVFSVCCAVAIAAIVSIAARFTGFSSEESVYLSMNATGNIDILGILMGSIIIGMLGVLDDIAVTQVSVVHQLKKALPGSSVMNIFWRGLAVGKDHAAALVNTLVLAYTGSALPLILLLVSAQSDLSVLINQENFATEIVKMLVGSMGLIVCVPIATLLAAYFLHDHDHVPEGCPGCAAHTH